MASEPARARLFWAILSLDLLIMFGHPTACRSLALAFSAVIPFAIERPAPCSTILRHSPLSWAAVVHWSALIPKTLRSSRKYPNHSFFCPPPPMQPAPTNDSPDIAHFDSLVSSMLATNPANRIRFPRVITSMLSFPVFINVSRN